MAKADLHVHTKYSHHASEWFLKRLGAAESYTLPEKVRVMADERGMDYFTVTDHNSFGAAAELLESHPLRFIPGVESTSYFPEDNTKVHILVYGLSEEQFNEIQRIRTDIYDLRDYIREQELTYSVAHATYSVNGQLGIHHLEKLILLFDVFESINGGRNRLHNRTWTRLLKGLGPREMEKLQRRYDIEPFDKTPWIKGFTGGSDDHGGLFIGKTWTVSEGETKETFLKNIRERRSFAEGRYNDFHGLAFTVYKVAYDFSREKSAGIANSPLSLFASHVFEDRKLSLLDRVRMGRLRSSGDSTLDAVKNSTARLMDILRSNGKIDVEEKLQIVYQQITEASDIVLGSVARDIERHFKDVDLYKLTKDLTTTLYGIFMAVPFFTAFIHMYRNRSLLDVLKVKYPDILRNGHKKVLWFTDTLTDLNGVSITLQTISQMAERQSRDISIVTSLGEARSVEDLPVNVINLPDVHSFKLPFYESYDIRIPSVLASLKTIYEQDPDEIYISTPGPLGLLGLVASRLLGIRTTGIYHTDFTLEAADITESEDLPRHIETYINWFYSAMTRVLVPTREYIDILARRGMETEKMEIFPRGIDTESFTPASIDNSCENHALNLLYVGRISKDKNLDFLFSVYEESRRNSETAVRLTLVGDGPYLQDLRKRYAGRQDIHFTGAVPYHSLPDIYSAADLFLFPSTTDTFGMVVLEAQACGLPAVVSDMGGPKEIIQHGSTGYIARANDLHDWVNKIRILLEINRQSTLDYLEMKKKSRELVEREYSWARKLSQLLDGESEQKSTPFSVGNVTKPAA